MIKSFLTITLIFRLMFACGGGSSDNSTSFESGGGSSNGQGGSLARFAVTKDHLYVVKLDGVETYDVSQADNPIKKHSLQIGGDLETIFPRGNELFIGSMSGMYILSISNPSTPSLISNYRHIVACDPVVANQDFAYVTLRSDPDLNCWNSVNELQIISLKDLNKPNLISQQRMDNPKGLGLLGKKIFICDDKLEMYDLTNPVEPEFQKSFDIPANDVIPYEDILIVTADDGIYQYKLENDELSLLSKIGVSN